MSAAAYIVVYGRDTRLAETRMMLLRQAGHRVFAARTTTDVIKMEANPIVDLLVLCHTLSTDDSGRAASVARTRWPAMMTLVLTVAESRDPSGAAETVFDATDGPREFLHVVGRLLEHLQPRGHEIHP